MAINSIEVRRSPANWSEDQEFEPGYESARWKNGATMLGTTVILPSAAIKPFVLVVVILGSKILRDIGRKKWDRSKDKQKINNF